MQDRDKGDCELGLRKAEQAHEVERASPSFTCSKADKNKQLKKFRQFPNVLGSMLQSGNAGKTEFTVFDDNLIMPAKFQSFLVDIERDDDVETDSEIFQKSLERCLFDCSQTDQVSKLSLA